MSSFVWLKRVVFSTAPKLGSLRGGVLFLVFHLDVIEAKLIMVADLCNGYLGGSNFLVSRLTLEGQGENNHLVRSHFGSSSSSNTGICHALPFPFLPL